MAKEIKIAISGVGNCSSSLVQGLFFYKNVEGTDEPVPGLMHNVVGGYRINHIRPVAAFDIDARKVGKDLSEAIFAAPNCTKVFCNDVPNLGVEVKMGPVLDGVADHMKDYPEHRTFVISKEKPVDVVKTLKESGADLLINYMPVGSEEATQFYAQCALDAGIGFINCMPVFIASTPEWERKFADRKLPIIGDDVKSQVGATIVHRVLTKLFADRGVKLTRSYQLNTGGNTDFLNMLSRARLKSKKISKTEAVNSQLPVPMSTEQLHIGPSDYVPWQNDNKVCYIRMEGLKFGNVPLELDLKLSVEDSPNSAGCIIDAIRMMKLALDRGVGGVLISPSSYFMKHPIQQFPDSVAKQMVEEFISGQRER